MRLWATACVVITLGALAGCHKKTTDAAASDAAPTDSSAAALAAGTSDDPGFMGLGSKHGRYAAVGIYQPGAGWLEMLMDQKVVREHDSGSIPDQAIIVVTDSQTGEVRACGDMTGRCVGMNPWKTPLTGDQIAPIRLKATAGSRDDQPASNTASSAPASR